MDQWEQIVWVMMPCSQEWMDEQKVTVINIEEDIEGRDLLTYICPKCSQIHKSLRCSR